MGWCLGDEEGLLFLKKEAKNFGEFRLALAG
jgi:hypothetical protein